MIWFVYGLRYCLHLHRCCDLFQVIAEERVLDYHVIEAERCLLVIELVRQDVGYYHYSTLSFNPLDSRLVINYVSLLWSVNYLINRICLYRII